MVPTPNLTPPSSPSFGTPRFLERVLALPALSDAFNLASHYYDNSKSNKVVGVALRAAEASVRMGLSGALPLAQPIVQRVGGWSAIDKWACQGLDKVQKVAPIITLPTKELVQVTRQGVLGVVAGNKVTVPPTMTGALTARAMRVMNVFVDNSGTRAVAGMLRNVINGTNTLIDTYLPPAKNDRRDPVVRGDEGVMRGTWNLARKAGHRVYYTALRTMRPDLTHQPDATITWGMMITYVQTTAVTWYTKGLTSVRELQGSILFWPIDLASNLSRQPQRVRQVIYNLSIRAKANPTTAPFVTMIESGFNNVSRMPGEVIRVLQMPVDQVTISARKFVQGLSDLLQSRVATFTHYIRVVQKTVMPMWEDISKEAATNIRASLVQRQSMTDDNINTGKEGQIIVSRKRENVKWELK
ncbi:hypothetical protein Pmani_034726 [Petrolisthes manimaculis]|uniref:Uncharacterized protein n=1 Tax=Petrolisthes manimaculis TaxID=1843537 RepID=A0AAE1NPC7_9EUCA|nr:hypothetical protein Pmani_034726 [Petrolisthes manimaculis]